MSRSGKKSAAPASHGHARKNAHATVHAAAHASTAGDDLHATDALPQTLELSADQKALVRTLEFFSNYEMAHMRKVPEDVVPAFSNDVLAVIAQSAVLGGDARKKAIDQLLADEQSLAAVAAIVGPIAQVVGQNLANAHAKLGVHAGEVLKGAQSVAGTQPHLIQRLAGLEAWSKKHHPGHGTPPSSGAKSTGLTG